MRTRILKIKEDQKFIGQEVTVKGWVRTVRAQKNFAFLELNDGSTLSNLQVIVEKLPPDITTGTAVVISGKVVESLGTKQKNELYAHKIHYLGSCDPVTYPLQKKRHSLEFLREITHLRPRTNVIGAITRIRNTLAYATHSFFQKMGFFYLQTPVITFSDSEGAGQLFQITTLDQTQSKEKIETIDHSESFFGKKAYLNVSGQLNAETYACALSDVYTFGPTFRAENSHTSRHLAEFWMIEPEMAFADLYDNMDLAENYLKNLFSEIVNTHLEDMELFDKYIHKGVIARLKKTISEPFVRMTYDEAITILKKSPKTFTFPPSWGSDLQAEHERYLCEEYVEGPLILTNYPANIKPFYMRNNDDGKTVAAMDLLVPNVGEVIGGSEREERIEVLEKKIKDKGLNREDYWWYLDLRRYGSVPHAGFGAGFERLVQFVTGMENIRDVVAFPRYAGHAEF
ncbi:MAG: asparagine--tRNA ligase [Chlamydiales bacterium]